MTGFPRSSGRSRCSTAAKNASRSTWRIVGLVRTRLSSRRRDAVRKPLRHTRRRRGRSPRSRPTVLRCRVAAVVVVAVASSSRSPGPSRPSPSSSRGRSSSSSPAGSSSPGQCRASASQGASASGSSPRPSSRRTSPTSSAWPPAASIVPSPSPSPSCLAVASLVLAVAAAARPRSAARPGPAPRRSTQPAASACPSSSPPSPPSGLGGILAANAWHEIPTGWVSGGWNWSDFLVHVAIGQSLAQGNFPPEVPYFAGVPLTYHWFADFHGALSALLAGTHVIPVFIVTNGILAGALALVAWELARTLLGSRRAATIATILVLVGGGMGWIRLVLDVGAGAGAAWELVQANPYDNTWAPGWPYFRIASILGTGMFPHRATVFGLAGAAGRPPPRPRLARAAAGGNGAGRRPGRAAGAVPLLLLPGDLPPRLPVRASRSGPGGAVAGSATPPSSSPRSSSRSRSSSARRCSSAIAARSAWSRAGPRPRSRRGPGQSRSST